VGQHLRQCQGPDPFSAGEGSETAAVRQRCDEPPVAGSGHQQQSAARHSGHHQEEKLGERIVNVRRVRGLHQPRCPSAPIVQHHGGSQDKPGEVPADRQGEQGGGRALATCGVEAHAEEEVSAEPESAVAQVQGQLRKSCLDTGFHWPSPNRVTILLMWFSSNYK